MNTDTLDEKNKRASVGDIRVEVIERQASRSGQREILFAAAIGDTAEPPAYIIESRDGLDEYAQSLHRKSPDADPDQIRNLIDRAIDDYDQKQQRDWETVKQSNRSRATNLPSTKAVDDWHPFPIDAMPPVMTRFAAEVERTMCVDPAMAALPMLSIAGACIGNTARARMSFDWFAPPNIWSAVICRSGDTKSPALKAVMRPIYEAQAERDEQYRQSLAEYKAELTAWKAKTKKERSADDAKEPQEPPPYQHLYISDATTEAVALRLLDQPRGLALIMDELAAFFTSMNQYKARGGHDRESYLAFYGAEAAKIDRKSATPPTIFIPRAFVAVTGMIQPGRIAELLTDAEHDSGMAARFLLAAPPPRQATWVADGIADDVRDGWRDLLLGMLGSNLPEDPALIPPSDGAMRLWSTTYNRMSAVKFNEPDDRMRQAMAKIIGTIPRLALIFQAVSAASGERSACFRVLDELSMRRAIAIAEWCVRETRRVYAMLSGKNGDDDLLRMIEDRGGTITTRELMRTTRQFKSASDATAFLDSLEREKLGDWRWRPVGAKGGKPMRLFALRVDNTPAQ